MILYFFFNALLKLCYTFDSFIIRSPNSKMIADAMANMIMGNNLIQVMV